MPVSGHLSRFIQSLQGCISSPLLMIMREHGQCHFVYITELDLSQSLWWQQRLKQVLKCQYLPRSLHCLTAKKVTIGTLTIIKPKTSYFTHASDKTSEQINYKECCMFLKIFSGVTFTIISYIKSLRLPSVDEDTHTDGCCDGTDDSRYYGDDDIQVSIKRTLLLRHVWYHIL
jgi:hypothetical protein